MKLIIILLLLVGCAGSPEGNYARQDAYNIEYDRFLKFERRCEGRGGNIEFPHKYSTRIRRGFTLEDLRTAECKYR